MTTYRLEELSVDKVAFVPEGDNKGAHILLFKSKAEPNQEAKTPEKGVSNVKIDKSKMTPEEQAILAEFEKKYGVGEATEPEAEPEDGVQKGSELHPDVAKALASFQEITRQQAAEVEELKKAWKSNGSQQRPKSKRFLEKSSGTGRKIVRTEKGWRYGLCGLCGSAG